jgi:hypothetical protein
MMGPASRGKKPKIELATMKTLKTLKSSLETTKRRLLRNSNILLKRYTTTQSTSPARFPLKKAQSLIHAHIAFLSH